MQALKPQCAVCYFACKLITFTHLFKTLIQTLGLSINKTKFDVILSEDSQMLNDVEVIDSKSISKTTFTCSSSKIEADDLKIKGTTNVSTLLEGQVATQPTRV